jgi:hypothetical protein
VEDVVLPGHPAEPALRSRKRLFCVHEGQRLAVLLAVMVGRPLVAFRDRPGDLGGSPGSIPCYLTRPAGFLRTSTRRAGDRTPLPFWQWAANSASPRLWNDPAQATVATFGPFSNGRLPPSRRGSLGVPFLRGRWSAGTRSASNPHDRFFPNQGHAQRRFRKPDRAHTGR